MFRYAKLSLSVLLALCAPAERQTACAPQSQANHHTDAKVNQRALPRVRKRFFFFEINARKSFGRCGNLVQPVTSIFWCGVASYVLTRQKNNGKKLPLSSNLVPTPGLVAVSIGHGVHRVKKSSRPSSNYTHRTVKKNHCIFEMYLLHRNVRKIHCIPHG